MATTTMATTTTASVSPVAATSIDGRALASGVADAAAAVHAAASTRDLEALRALMSPDFAFSFGGASDPITYWQELEAQGQDPFGNLATALELPPNLDAYSDGQNIVAVPYLFSKPPIAYDDADAAASEQLGYDQNDIQF